MLCAKGTDLPTLSRIGKHSQLSTARDSFYNSTAYTRVQVWTCFWLCRMIEMRSAKPNWPAEPTPNCHPVTVGHSSVLNLRSKMSKHTKKKLQIYLTKKRFPLSKT